MSDIILPKVYSEFLWERSKNPAHRKYIGKQFLSWSQVETFLSKTGFNTGLIGEYEYVIRYFSGFKFDDMGWGTFGNECENYITLKADSDKFTEKEKEVLNKIKPLGVFQDEILYYIEDLDVVILGYLDDRSPEVDGIVELLRDYKTKSESSKKDLHDDKKHQLEIYILGLRQRGLEVKSAEYCIIERFGGKECMMGGGRGVLSIGEIIWYEPYSWTEERLQQTHDLLVSTVKEISALYKVYQNYFGEKK